MIDGKLKIHAYILIMIHISDEKNKYGISFFHLSSTIIANILMYFLTQENQAV